MSYDTKLMFPPHCHRCCQDGENYLGIFSNDYINSESNKSVGTHNYFKKSTAQNECIQQGEGTLGPLLKHILLGTKSLQRSRSRSMPAISNLGMNESEPNFSITSAILASLKEEDPMWYQRQQILEIKEDKKDRKKVNISDKTSDQPMKSHKKEIQRDIKSKAPKESCTYSTEETQPMGDLKEQPSNEKPILENIAPQENLKSESHSIQQKGKPELKSDLSKIDYYSMPPHSDHHFDTEDFNRKLRYLSQYANESESQEVILNTLPPDKTFMKSLVKENETVLTSMNDSMQKLKEATTTYKTLAKAIHCCEETFSEEKSELIQQKKDFELSQRQKENDYCTKLSQLQHMLDELKMKKEELEKDKRDIERHWKVEFENFSDLIQHRSKIHLDVFSFWHGKWEEYNHHLIHWDSILNKSQGQLAIIKEELQKRRRACANLEMLLKKAKSQIKQKEREVVELKKGSQCSLQDIKQLHYQIEQLQKQGESKQKKLENLNKEKEHSLEVIQKLQEELESSRISLEDSARKSNESLQQMQEKEKSWSDTLKKSNQQTEIYEDDINELRAKVKLLQTKNDDTWKTVTEKEEENMKLVEELKQKNSQHSILVSSLQERLANLQQQSYQEKANAQVWKQQLDIEVERHNHTRQELEENQKQLLLLSTSFKESKESTFDDEETQDMEKQMYQEGYMSAMKEKDMLSSQIVQLKHQLDQQSQEWKQEKEAMSNKMIQEKEKVTKEQEQIVDILRTTQEKLLKHSTQVQNLRETKEELQSEIMLLRAQFQGTIQEEAGSWIERIHLLSQKLDKATLELETEKSENKKLTRLFEEKKETITHLEVALEESQRKITDLTHRWQKMQSEVGLEKQLLQSMISQEKEAKKVIQEKLRQQEQQNFEIKSMSSRKQNEENVFRRSTLASPSPGLEVGSTFTETPILRIIQFEYPDLFNQFLTMDPRFKHTTLVILFLWYKLLEWIPSQDDHSKRNILRNAKAIETEIDLQVWIDGLVQHIGKKIPPQRSFVVETSQENEISTPDTSTVHQGRAQLNNPLQHMLAMNSRGARQKLTSLLGLLCRRTKHGSILHLQLTEEQRQFFLAYYRILRDPKTTSDVIATMQVLTNSLQELEYAFINTRKKWITKEKEDQDPITDT